VVWRPLTSVPIVVATAAVRLVAPGFIAILLSDVGEHRLVIV
jgi:hypothetical protein